MWVSFSFASMNRDLQRKWRCRVLMENEWRESVKWDLCTDEPSEECGPDIWVCVLLTRVQAERKCSLLTAAVRLFLPRSGFSFLFQMMSERLSQAGYLCPSPSCVSVDTICVLTAFHGVVFSSACPT